MKQCKWIWYPGDFEIYHSNLVHSRREELGVAYPSMWLQAMPFPRLNFTKTAECDSDRTITVYSRSMGRWSVDDERYPLNTPVSVKKGKHTIQVSLFDSQDLPSVFIDDEFYGTDESWLVNNGSANAFPAEATPAYTDANENPSVFRFSYQEIFPVFQERVEDGILYDYGKEMFGPITLSGLPKTQEIHIIYGESREEALDEENAIIRQTVSGAEEYHLVPRAFRYIWIRCPEEIKYQMEAKLEYLPLEDKGYFRCEDDFIRKIWDACAYTFHLNSREFFQDAVKRDRWVWAGDSYQSYLTDYYLYFDKEIIKRTIRSLLGKPPYEQHINSINDYTPYLFFGLWDYYYATGDLAFVKCVWPRFNALYQFMLARLDQDGQMIERKGDWIFIDWSEIDKAGPLCAEQILLWRTICLMADFACLLGEDDAPYLQRADALKELINQRYWNQEKQAYIDNYVSGQNHVSRHANIFAILYDFADQERQNVLVKSVLNNDKITQITTPYFKFFELCARCKMGDLPFAQNMIRFYWGGMLEQGATTIWEEYDPNEKGIEHYAMYGKKFGRSLCHAWGGGPIYLLGRYCLGVKATSVAYQTFSVEPKLGIYHELHGAVPLPNGRVTVDYADNLLSVWTDCDGGSLLVNGADYSIPKNQRLEIHCTLK